MERENKKFIILLRRIPMQMILLSLLYIMKNAVFILRYFPFLQSDPKMLINISGQSKDPSNNLYIPCVFFSLLFFYFPATDVSLSVLVLSLN